LVVRLASAFRHVLAAVLLVRQRLRQPVPWIRQVWKAY
jgi:hypothetical protein